MSAIEDTGEARERAERMLTEVAAGEISRIRLGQVYVYARAGAELGDDDRDAMRLLRGRDLIEHGDQLVGLTVKGRSVLGVSGTTDADPPAPPPLLCDSIPIHGQDPPAAAVICIDSTGGMKRMLQCAECAPIYALTAASLAVAAYKLDPSAPPAAVYFLPLPQSWTGA